MVTSHLSGLTGLAVAKPPDLVSEKSGAGGAVDAVKGIGSFIREVADGQEKMAAAMRDAFSGRKLGGVEMLAVQAGIYRVSAELDLAARLVEKLSSGVKQAMNTQVG